MSAASTWVVRIADASSEDPVLASLWETQPTAVEEVGDALIAGYPDQRRAERAAGYFGDRAEVIEVVDDAWADAWRVHAEPIVVGDLAVVPPWRTAPPGVPVVVTIDPGRSFGSGSHPSTQLILGLLPSVVTGRTSVLDVGSGSGVLAIAAAALGASPVVGIDIDEDAPRVAQLNAEANGLSDHTTFSNTPVEKVDGRFDVVVANILPGTLLRLADDLVDHLAPAGRLLLSGIPVEDVDRVAAGFRAAELARVELDGWAALVVADQTR